MACFSAVSFLLLVRIMPNYSVSGTVDIADSGSNQKDAACSLNKRQKRVVPSDFAIKMAAFRIFFFFWRFSQRIIEHTTYAPVSFALSLCLSVCM